VPLDDKRVVWFWFVPGPDGRPIVRDLRINWVGEGPPEDLTTAVINKSRLGTARDRAVAKLVRECDLLEADGDYLIEPPSVLQGRYVPENGEDVTELYLDDLRKGRQPPARDQLLRLAEVAQLYVDLNSYKAMAQEIAKRRSATELEQQTLRLRVVKARKAGLLSPAGQPKRLTRLAELVLELRKHDAGDIHLTPWRGKFPGRVIENAELFGRLQDDQQPAVEPQDEQRGEVRATPPIRVPLDANRVVWFWFVPGPDGRPIVRDLSIKWVGEGPPEDLTTAVINKSRLGKARDRAVEKLVRECDLLGADGDYLIEPPSVLQGLHVPENGEDVTELYLDDLRKGRQPPR
jgi:hypothetical protein